MINNRKETQTAQRGERMAVTMDNAYEIVPHPKLRHINLFLNRICYRNFHMHSDFEVFCVLDGSAVIQKRGERMQARPGSVILLNSNEAHEINASGASVTALVLQVSNHFLREYAPVLRNTAFEKSDLSACLTEAERNTLHAKIQSIACDYLLAERFNALNCIAHTAELFAFLLESVPHASSSEAAYLSRKRIALRMNRIQAYIDEAYKAPVRLSDVAEREGISATYLSHFFSEHFGITFQEYLNNIRFEHAVRLMSASGMPLYEIALSSGFSDPKYMAKMFLRRFGCQPAEFRAQIVHPPAAQHASDPPKLLEYRYPEDEARRLLKGYWSWNETL